MNTRVQLRRGTKAQNDAFTGAVGELTVDTTNMTLRLHDGIKQGGYSAGRAPMVTSAQRDALSPTESDIIYNTDIHNFEWWDGAMWRTF